MIYLKTEYPYNNNVNLVRTYAEDENNNAYYIIQNETNVKYDSAIDIFPSKYSYKVTEEKIESNTDTLESIESS